MGLKTSIDLVNQNPSMKLDDFLNLFRQTEVPAPLSGETVRQFGSFSAAVGNQQERTALSNRARQV